MGYSLWGCRVRYDLATKQQQICKKERNILEKMYRLTEACVIVTQDLKRVMGGLGEDEDKDKTENGV